jgi:hypothetical protein
MYPDLPGVKMMSTFVNCVIRSELDKYHTSYYDLQHVGEVICVKSAICTKKTKAHVG